MGATRAINPPAVPAMPSRNELFYAVDRLEGRVVVLIDDDGTTIERDRGALPKGTREGSVIRVSLGADGDPDWISAALDEKERQRRLKKAKDQLRKLSDRDPGGDITL